MRTKLLVQTTAHTSLRKAIIKDSTLSVQHLEVAYEKKRVRRNGWSKLRSVAREIRGSINLQWNCHTKQLVCWVVTKNGNSPSPLIHDFCIYLLTRHGEFIESIVLDDMIVDIRQIRSAVA